MVRLAAPSTAAGRLVLVGVLVVVLGVQPGGAAWADTTDGRAGWRQTLARSAEAGDQRPYTGEVLSVVWTGEDTNVTLARLHSGHGHLTVQADDAYTVQLGRRGGDLVNHEQGWLAPLPPADATRVDWHLDAIAEKYEIAAVGDERLLDRPCTLLEIRRRADQGLRERLWIDDETGLVLRRESFAGAEQPLRLSVFLSLDLRPRPVGGTRGRVPVSPTRLERREQAMKAVDPKHLDALREAGWSVPTTLPGGYRPTGVFAYSTEDSLPLHLVYRDGLYTVSVFQQRGRPDWDSLPEGAQPAEDLEWPAFEWPGAVPRRLVWEASGTTYSLVGDAPPDELTAIAQALPRPQAGGRMERLRRGLSRLWSAMSPWG